MYFINDIIVSEKLLNPLHNANVLYKIKSRLIGGMDNIIREFDIGEIYIPYTTNKSKRKFYEDVINEVSKRNY